MQEKMKELDILYVYFVHWNVISLPLTPLYSLGILPTKAKDRQIDAPEKIAH